MKESCRSRSRTPVAVAVTVAGLIGVAAAADVVQLEPVKDNTLFGTDTDNSSGAGTAVFSGRTGTLGDGARLRAVLAFDVSAAIPPGSTVTSASLTLHLVQASPFGVKESHTLHRILADWGEGTSRGIGGQGAPATPGDATWRHTYFPDEFWVTEGGDFDPTISGSQTVGVALGPYTWGATPLMVADVQGWVDDPSLNFGWLLLGNEIDDFTAKKFGSRETDVSLRPVLTVEFEAPQCPWDCGDGDGPVGIVDLLALLIQWDGPGACDFDGSGTVGITDLLKLLANWGACP